MKDTSLKILSSSALKIIAVISMLVDHIAATGLFFKIYEGDMSIQIYRLMRMVGRLAFPIYIFLLVEGFVHTKNIKKYIIRMMLFAIVSEVPFDLAFSDSFFYINYQNVMWSLLICVVMLYFIKKYPDFKFFTIIISCAAAWLIQCDYYFIGPLAAACIYLLRDKKIYRNLSIGVIFAFEVTAILSLIPMNMYNGKRGINLKYLFYAFYPAHLLVLVYLRGL